MSNITSDGALMSSGFVSKILKIAHDLVDNNNGGLMRVQMVQEFQSDSNFEPSDD